MSRPAVTSIKAPVEEIWDASQTPGQHQRWDLRFTSIDYLPKASDAEPQKFLYSTRIGFGLKISGEGESRGEVRGEDGSRVSVVRFWSDERLSLIRCRTISVTRFSSFDILLVIAFCRPQ